jgi:streptomycin 6-kinase
VVSAWAHSSLLRHLARRVPLVGSGLYQGTGCSRAIKGPKTNPPSVGKLSLSPTTLPWKKLEFSLDMFQIPPALNWLEQSSSGRDWLRELPARVRTCADRWKLSLEPPFQQSFVSIVFPAKLADGLPRVLKIQYPDWESEHEAEALRLWNGHGTVRLFDFDPAHHALLLERCRPGDHLSTIGATQALEVLVGLLPRLWVPAGAPFRSLSDEAAGWLQELPESWDRAGRPFERELLEAALDAIGRLGPTQREQVLLHQDLHGDNVLRSEREPWLVIDPKPLVGEKAFSLAPIIRSSEFGYSRREIIHRLDTLSAALRVDRERARLWALAQTLAWGFADDQVHPRHVETARWLWLA